MKFLQRLKRARVMAYMDLIVNNSPAVSAKYTISLTNRAKLKDRDFVLNACMETVHSVCHKAQFINYLEALFFTNVQFDINRAVRVLQQAGFVCTTTTTEVRGVKYTSFTINGRHFPTLAKEVQK